MKRVVNRKARFDYELLEKVEAGIILTGAEVKSIKQGQISLKESFVRIDDNGEVWLVNAHVHPYKFADNKDYEPTRSRKLLLRKNEILGLLKKAEGKNLTLIPTAIYTRKNKIKIEVAIGKGKKKWDKRRVIKEREGKREARAAMKEKNR